MDVNDDSQLKVTAFFKKLNDGEKLLPIKRTMSGPVPLPPKKRPVGDPKSIFMKI